MQLDVHDVRVAEEVVQVAERLLVRAHEERREEVGAAVGGVESQRLLDVAQIDERVDLAVGVAGDVGQGRAPEIVGCAARWSSSRRTMRPFAVVSRGSTIGMPGRVMELRPNSPSDTPLAVSIARSKSCHVALA